ncbi:uncharacterized protein LOC115622487 [Scaptodrosophila lebanonensis]|uniref:Uncharacterized protein LOC115622487 n=1 Tax=Drosophila lebanonensis TaxID=7225 RepID=A0A6J2TB13_DROLE|nr:uncharacterized protein LOC115622487 [Scaptodrosophila lebanonensis]
MSSYRSYTPWKTSLGSSYKPGSSTYSSRDDIAGSSRYSSLATPSAYRPSFSGGTYRIKREQPPAPVTSYVSRYGSAKSDPKDTSSSDVRDKSSPIKRYVGGSSTLGKYGRSRDPSPVALEHTNRIKSREPSPVRSGLRGKSRDPSPVIDSGRNKLGSGSYRLGTVGSSSSGNSSTSRNGYGSRYSGAGSNTRLNTANLDKSISYLTTSDFHARSASRARELATRKSNEKELETKAAAEEVTAPPILNVNGAAVSETDSSAEEEQPSGEQETFISVSVVTRATSPTPPGSTTVQRTRRIDPAKTIEKTIQRSTKPRQMATKEIQSDRLDDSTRYLRYSAGSSVSSYSSHRDRISSLRYSASPQSGTNSNKSSSIEPSRQQETPSKSPSNGHSSTSKSSSKSKLSPPKVVRLNSRQSSVENLTNKPPAPPSKSESPTKTTSSSNSANSNGVAGVVKWPNKDFRKSSLNVGPTDRPRKSRTPSSSGESDNPLQLPDKEAPTQPNRLERSPSGGSEASITSAGSLARKGAKVANGRCHAKASLSRQNSGAQPKASHKSCAPAKEPNTASSSASVSASSCSDSSSEQQRTKAGNKKLAKKKTSNSHNTSSSSNGKEAKAKPTGVTIDEQELSPELSSNHENRHNQIAATDSCPQAQETKQQQSQSQQQSSRRLQKLSSVSNFFATRQHDANSEPIFLESSESSGELDALPPSSSLTTDFKTNATNFSTITTNTYQLTTANISNTELDPPCTPRSSSQVSSSTQHPRDTTTTTTTTTSVNGKGSEYTTSFAVTSSNTTTEEPEQEDEEPSWWQDTSLQINTASALDYNNRDEMRFKLRHIDSGEQAWWLRQEPGGDEDDTLAEETLNQLDDEADDADATEAADYSRSASTGAKSQRQSSKADWWSSAGVDEQETTNEAQRNDLNGKCSEAEKQDESWQAKQMPRSRISPEHDAWWLDEEEKPQQQSTSHNKENVPQPSNGVSWWTTEDENNNEPHVEATIKLPSKQPAPLERSPSSHKKSASSSDSSKHWWLSGPSKKQFNVQRVESGERAWWQEEPAPPAPSTPHWESGERAWWLNDDDAENEPPQQKSHDNSSMKLLERDQVDFQNGCQHDAEVQQINQHANKKSVPIGNDTVNNAAACELSSSFNFTFAVRPPPLGQCASPIAVDAPPTPPPRNQSKSPYDNIPMSKVQVATATTTVAQALPASPSSPPTSQRYSPNARRASTAANGGKLFISRHQNIDELLGGACRPLSPLFYGHNDNQTPLASKNMFLLEEITPDQVRIHDSTAQLPVIQRMQR